MRVWSRLALWLSKPGALRLPIPPLSAEMAAYRLRVLLSVLGLGLVVLAVLGVTATNGLPWAWLGMIFVVSGVIWSLVTNEARIRVLPYLQLLEGAYALENHVYVADSKPGQPRLSIGDITGTARDYRLHEVNAGAGLDWNTESGRQNLAATILADTLDSKLLDGEGGPDLKQELIKGFAGEMAIFFFRREERGKVYLRENFSTTRQAVINFIAARL